MKTEVDLALEVIAREFLGFKTLDTSDHGLGKISDGGQRLS